MCPLPTTPSGIWPTGSSVLSRRNRRRSANFAQRYPFVKMILLSFAEASPYLFDLVRARRRRGLIRLFEKRSRIPTFSRLIEKRPPRGARCVERSRSDAVAPPARNRKPHFLIALCDVGGVWPVMQVTGGADRSGGRVGAIGAAFCVAAGSRARTAVAAESRMPGAR